MIILRQKEFGWFGFGKKKQPEQKAPEYKCPSISDLPTNLQQSLRGVERVWKKPETQKLLKELQRLVGDQDTFPYTPYLEPENAFERMILPSLEAEIFPENTLMYPLMWNCGLCDGELICYDITGKKFWAIDGHDWNFEEADNIKVLNDWIKADLNFLDKEIKEKDLDYYKVTLSDFKNLLKQIRKVFWI